MIKVYFHLSLDGFSNSYLAADDTTGDAIIIDPGKISKEVIMHIEDNHYDLKAVLITHNHSSHYSGLETLKKIYSPLIYAGDYEIAGTGKMLLKGEGLLTIGSMKIGYASLPGHTFDSVIFKIGRMLFTGDSLTAGMLGTTSNKYAEKLLKDNIKKKILSQMDEVVLMPGHGPPTCVGIEKLYNIGLTDPAPAKDVL